MKTIAETAEDIVGTWRRFGVEGPVYQVINKAGVGKVHIRVVETGEELDYLVERALRDPEAE